jgi:hypothetical protein
MRFALISAIFASVAITAPAATAKAVKHSNPPKNQTMKGPPESNLTGLLHATADRVRSRLGEPSIARAEGKGAFWTYRGQNCALYIFFKDEGGLKVSGAAVGPRKRGVTAPDLNICLAELEHSQVGASNP